MKRLGVALALLLTTGCLAYTTPSGTYIQPLLDFVVVGPPAVVAAPPAVAYSPLPPVVIVPDRPVYSYGGAFYYYWGNSWYWGRSRSGPWHSLPPAYWPREVRRHDDHGRGRGQGHGGGRH